jgi:hypothetical protein
LTTVAGVLDVARMHLYNGNEDELNRLNGAYTAAATTLTAEFALGGIRAGARLGIDLEEFHVWSVSGQVATVKGAHNGSTAANHADDSIIRVNPQFSDFSLFTALNEEIQALSARGLVKVTPVELTATGARTGYDITGSSTILDVRSVQRESAYASEANWPVVRNFRWTSGHATADFPSTNALFVYEYVDAGRGLRVIYDAPLTVVTGPTQDITTIVGLHAEAHDILSLGVALRRMAGREIRRNVIDRQGDSRRAEEVPPGAVSQSSRDLRRLYEDRIAAEVDRLNQRYPRMGAH